MSGLSEVARSRIRAGVEIEGKKEPI